MNVSRLRPLLPLVVFPHFAIGQSLLQQHGEVVLVAGDTAPGLVGKSILASWSGLTTPVCDLDGTVLFQARLTPAGVDDRALYLGRSRADLQLLAQSGDQAPGLPAGTLLRSSNASSGSALENDPAISAAGQIAFFGSGIYDPGNPGNTPTTADTALFWGTIGNLTAIAREGDQVPGMPAGVTFGHLQFDRDDHRIGPDGTVCLPCALGGNVNSSNDAAILTGTPGSLVVVAREGDPVNGTTLTWRAVFGNTLSNSYAINGTGEILLDARFAGSANNSNDRGLVVWRPGSGASIISREGSQAPGMPTGVVTTGNPAQGGNVWNDSGKTLFTWTVAGPSITLDNNTATFYGGTGGVSKVLQEGDAIGLPTGETWGNVVNASLNSNESGTLALAGELRDANGNALPSNVDSALLVATEPEWHAGNWRLVVREGDVIPAIPPSVHGPWVCGSVNSSINLNGRGQVVFVQDANDGMDTVHFLLIHDPDHGLRLARDGQETYATPAGTGQVNSGMTFAGNVTGGGGCPMWLTNNGEFVYHESLDNGVEAAIIKGHSGALIGTPSTIPATGGTHALTIDCGSNRANHLYLVIGSLSGTHPGFASPLGPITIPLNPDPWLDISLGYANSGIYPNSLGLLDASGRPTAPVSFQLPAGVTGLTDATLHHVVITFDGAFVNNYATEPAPLKFL